MQWKREIRRRKRGEEMIEKIAVIAMAVAAMLTAINQISIVITAKQLWLQQQQLQRRLEKLQKELSGL